MHARHAEAHQASWTALSVSNGLDSQALLFMAVHLSGVLAAGLKPYFVWRHVGFLTASAGGQVAVEIMPDLQQEGSKNVDLAGIYDSRGRPSASHLQWLALLSLTGVLCSAKASASGFTSSCCTDRLAFSACIDKKQHLNGCHTQMPMDRGGFAAAALDTHAQHP